MLKQADNERLTSVGPGTPMGSLMREHWLPAMLARDVPADGPPLRVRLLGEDLVLFRDSEGALGLVQEACAHRGASLFYGRNEACGLRCPYHGWKYDRTGQCVDIPNERHGATFKRKIRITAYPVQQRNHVVWAYMGPSDPPPPLPEVEWDLLPASHVHLSLRVEECNWLQALEGEIDSSHGPFLHSRVDGHESPEKQVAYRLEDRHPKFEVTERDFGLMIAARRDYDDEHYYWRVNQFLMPFYTVVPPGGAEPNISGHAWVPMDDTHTLCVMFSYSPEEPLSEHKLRIYREGGGRGTREPGHPTVRGLRHRPGLPYAAYWPALHRGNDYQVDRSLEGKLFCGIPGLWAQDAACQESMGPVARRTTEHLGASDAGIVMTRRLLGRVVRAMEREGLRPPTAAGGDVYRVRSVGIVLPRGALWTEVVEPLARATDGFGYAIPGDRRGPGGDAVPAASVAT